jgi:hypothetical protein
MQTGQCAGEQNLCRGFKAQASAYLPIEKKCCTADRLLFLPYREKAEKIPSADGVFSASAPLRRSSEPDILPHGPARRENAGTLPSDYPFNLLLSLLNIFIRNSGAKQGSGNLPFQDVKI